MDVSLPAITPEMRQALAASGGSPIQFQDPETRQVNVVVERPTHPWLDEESILAGLQVALVQIAQGKHDDWNVEVAIAEAERLYAEQHDR